MDTIGGPIRLEIPAMKAMGRIEFWGRALAHRASRFQDKVAQLMPFESYPVTRERLPYEAYVVSLFARQAVFAAATRLCKSKLRILLNRQYLLPNNFFTFFLKP